MNRILEQIKQSCREIPSGLMDMIDARGDDVAGHCKRVAIMAHILAGEMGMSHGEVNAVAQSALLHDVGKIVIPTVILFKQGSLTAPERRVMQSHSQLGYDILRAYPDLEKASEAVYSHHERLDGTGYPRGLRGGEICPEARLLAVVDTYDAIRSNRVYAFGRSAEEAVEEIVLGRGKLFDPCIVDAFLRCQPRIESCIAWKKKEGTAECPTRPPSAKPGPA